MTLVASCGVFVIFRGAERFVFRARTNPKDAMPRRRCGEGRANITSSESELNGRLRPSNRGRRHGVATYPPPKAPEGIARWGAEPPVRTRIFVGSVSQLPKLPKLQVDKFKLFNILEVIVERA